MSSTVPFVRAGDMTSSMAHARHATADGGSGAGRNSGMQAARSYRRLGSAAQAEDVVQDVSNLGCRTRWARTPSPDWDGTEGSEPLELAVLILLEKLSATERAA